MSYAPIILPQEATQLFRLAVLIERQLKCTQIGLLSAVEAAGLKVETESRGAGSREQKELQKLVAAIESRGRH
jgi:hypothetical protein